MADPETDHQPPPSPEVQPVVSSAEARKQRDHELNVIRWQSEAQLAGLYHSTIAEVSKSAIDRARAGAEFVHKAAIALGSAYVALLALAFSATDRPLPLRGVLPAVFLGVATVASAAYLSTIQAGADVPARRAGSTLAETQERRTWFLARWIGQGVLTRRYEARVGILALMFGVAFLPAPFVAQTETSVRPTFAEAPTPDLSIPDPEARSKRFDVELELYRAASAAAIENGQTLAHPERSRDPDEVWLAAGVVGIGLTLGLPLLAGRQRVRKRST